RGITTVTLRASRRKPDVCPSMPWALPAYRGRSNWKRSQFLDGGEFIKILQPEHLQESVRRNVADLPGVGRFGLDEASADKLTDRGADVGADRLFHRRPRDRLP